MSSLIQEINHYRKEVVYSQFFRICFPDDVIYEKITRKQMVELIIQQYTPENIVDVCTVKELKLLKRIVENNYKEVDVHSMPFEKVALYRKYLLFENEIPMYIMSNPIKMNGAATMAYPGVIRNFAETIRKNLYVIPSSIHEVILVPESGTEDTSLNDMVAEVNHTQVDPKEVLADHVYYYDRKEDHMISCVHENICYC